VVLVRTDVLLAHILFLCSVLRLLVTANVVLSSPILVTMMMETIRSSEMSVLTGAIQRNTLHIVAWQRTSAASYN
jgi:hypothetical protein